MTTKIKEPLNIYLCISVIVLGSEENARLTHQQKWCLLFLFLQFVSIPKESEEYQAYQMPIVFSLSELYLVYHHMIYQDATHEHLHSRKDIPIGVPLFFIPLLCRYVAPFETFRALHGKLHFICNLVFDVSILILLHPDNSYWI